MNSGVLKAGEGRSSWVTGDLYTIKASGEETGGAFALIEAVVPPGGGPPPHIHRREDEAFYVLEGELHFHADGREIAAGAGSWVTLARGSLHHFKNIGETPAKLASNPDIVLCALLPDLCSPLSTALKALGLARTGALNADGTMRTTEVEPIDRTLGGLVEVNR